MEIVNFAEVYPGRISTRLGDMVTTLFLSSVEMSMLNRFAGAYVSVIGTIIGYPILSTFISPILIKGASYN